MPREARRAVAILSGALAAAAALPAAAQDLAACRAIDDAGRRLACYDRAAGRDAAQAKEAKQAEAGREGAPERDAFALQWIDPGTQGFGPTEYRLNYFLPAFYTPHPNLSPALPGMAPGDPVARNAVEAKFQLSVKSNLRNGLFTKTDDLWFGYTQVSHWQLWDADLSRPFRESSYEPELFYTWRPATRVDLPFGLRLGHAGLSVNHNSNGQGGDASRSWNRVVAFARAHAGATQVGAKLWWRIREGDGNDDNPGIENYVGRAEVELVTHPWKGGRLQLTGRHSLRGGDANRGSIQADLSVRLGWLPGLSGHVQVFRGYGESLIDYNYLATHYGLGFALVDW